MNVVHQQRDLLNPALVLARGLHHVGHERGEACEEFLVQPFKFLAYVWEIEVGHRVSVSWSGGRDVFWFSGAGSTASLTSVGGVQLRAVQHVLHLLGLLIVTR